MKRWLKACACAIAVAMFSGLASNFAQARETAMPTQYKVLDADTMLDPAIPKAKVQAKKLTVIPDGPMEDMLTASTLQGLLSNKSEENIYIMGNQSYARWLEQLQADYGVEVRNGQSIWSELPQFVDQLDGYILCKTTMGDLPESGIANANRDESVNVANALCNQLNAIAVTEANEQKAKDAGLKMVLDVRGWDEETLREHKEYYDKLNKKIIVEEWQHIGANLRDFAVMANAMVFLSPGVEGNRHLFLEDMDPNFGVFGWGDPHVHEANFVTEASGYNGYTVAADIAYNLSVLSGYTADKLTQKTEKATGEVKGKHTVSFMMTDGDNLQWNLNDFTTSTKWFGSDKRGKFNMGWGVPASIIDLAPSAVQWMYNHMTPKDGFVVQLSGLGYFRPSMFSPNVLENHAKALNEYMGRLDTNIIEVIDEGFDNEEMWDIYMKQPNIDGALLIGFHGYEKFQGAINWSRGKPIVSARYSVANGNMGGALSMLEGVDQNDIVTTDPTKPSGYSLMMIHAWSYTMTDVQRMVDRLDPDKFDVVTPQELIARVEKNKPGLLTGWQEIDGRWYLYDQYGQPLAGWQKVDGKQYYLDIFGERMTGWQQIGDKYYYFGADGVMKTGWYKDGGKWYYSNSGGVMQTGWKKLGNKWYYLGSDGKMRTGWYMVGKKWYFSDGSGVMKTGWFKSGPKWYYADSSGAMKTGWQKVGGKWYYLGSDGKMRTGWYQVGKKWYFSDGSGAMKTGWFKSGSKWYYADSSGAMATGWKKLGGKWYYLGSDGGMRTGWYKVGAKWYFSDGSGRMLASTSRRIGSKTYRFNSSGVCVNP